ncbi:MAG: acetyl-CoA carboxylase biotin carboxyl carrier protein [Calditrichaeota bacterium]|nr:MAG: acetyl-CoA carboxylase biotin carboxyl carrier protein [Calditrichota bacterium]
MTEDQIQRLIKMVEGADIAELEVSKWGRKVRISKYPTNAGMAAMPQPAQIQLQTSTPAPAPGHSAASEINEIPAAPEEANPTPTETEGEQVKSPMVGTFYRAPAPEAPPYVSVGDTVKEGQVLCIIEAMKLMNEVEAEFPCRIIKIVNDDAQPVEYNQPLFIVERL